MSDEYVVSGQFDDFVIDRMQDQSALALQVIVSPQVVISRKKMDGDSPIRKFRKFSQKTGEAFGNDALVFIPKIEDVADKKYRFRIDRDFVQPLDKESLSVRGGLPDGQPQMDV